MVNDIYNSNIVVIQYHVMWQAYYVCAGKHKHVCYTTILCLLQLYIFTSVFIFIKNIKDIGL